MIFNIFFLLFSLALHASEKKDSSDSSLKDALLVTVPLETPLKAKKQNTHKESEDFQPSTQVLAQWVPEAKRIFFSDSISKQLVAQDPWFLDYGGEYAIWEEKTIRMMLHLKKIFKKNFPNHAFSHKMYEAKLEEYAWNKSCEYIEFMKKKHSSSCCCCIQ